MSSCSNNAIKRRNSFIGSGEEDVRFLMMAKTAWLSSSSAEGKRTERFAECLGSRLPGSWLYWETRAKS
jgi:hypothetical protein